MSVGINICFITDNNYCLATRVAVNSLIRNKLSTSVYNIWIIGVGLDKKNAQLLSNISHDASCHISILSQENGLAQLAQQHPHVSAAALCKFYIPNIFSNLDKILYLDSDVIIRGDLSDLYNIDLKQNYVAAVRDILGEQQGHAVKMQHRYYFNSGIMLLNLKQMRDDDIPDKLIEQKRNEPWHTFMDQDTLNYVFAEHVVYMPLKYNFMQYCLRSFSNADLANKFNVSNATIQDYRENPLIFHLAHKIKPWDTKSALGFEEWEKYLDRNARKEFLRRIKRLSHKNINSVTYYLFGCIPLFCIQREN